MASRKLAHAEPESAGLLILGMHRSGTSVLARALQLGGADIGRRLVEASAGNEGGHWEDAFAVETHERMLALLGRRWDDLVPLPAAWQTSDSARESARLIGEYVRNDRAGHALWAVKDPRLCEFGAIWRDEALRAGVSVGVVLAIRHPWEVARSLASRDGLSAGHGLLLWLNYTVSALQVADGLPTVIVTYDEFLSNWRKSTARIRALPGGRRLAWDASAAAELDRFINLDERHHVDSHEEGTLPALVGELWAQLDALAQAGMPPGDLASRATRAIAPARELLTPIVGDFRVTERKLWERVDRAETALAAIPTNATAEGAGLGEISVLVRTQHQDVMRALSEDIRHMQGTVAAALERSARSEGRVQQLEAGHGPDALHSVLRDGLDGLQAALASQLEPIAQARTGDADALGRLSQSSERMAGELGDVAGALPQIHAAMDALAVGAAELGPALAALDAMARRDADGRDAAAAGLAVGIAALREDAAARHAESARAAAANRDALLAVASEADGHVRAGISSLAGQLGAGLASLEAALASLRRERSLEAELQRTRRELLALRGLATATDSTLEATRRQLQAALAAGEASRQEAGALCIERDADADAAAKRLARIEVLESELAGMRAEADRQRGLVRGLRQDADALARVTATRSWRWTRPLRALARLVSGRWSDADRAALRALLGRRPAMRVQDAAQDAGGEALAALPGPRVSAIHLAPVIPGFADVFVWAVIDWDFRFQRPQHLAKSLADRGHRVFYVSNNFVDSAADGFRADPIDGSGRLFQVHLHLAGAPAIYFGLPDAGQVEALRGSLAALLAWTRSDASMSIVQHPYWSHLVRAVPNARVVYDCMDHHAGFENNASSVLAAESRLLRDSDLVIVTSLWLEEEVRKDARGCALVRNACDYAFFRDPPADVFRDPDDRPVIGYFGAVAEWFDVDLVRAVAVAHPDALVLLVGGDTVGAGQALSDLRNVRMVGEVRYDTLPYWLHGFDVALLPFRVIPLTLATNPVKVYEYLAAGKPVVVVDLPEMAQFHGLVRIGKTHPDFVAEVSAALAGDDRPGMRAARQQFAAGQTWDHRALAIDEAIASISEPLVTVVVLAYNNLAFTQACLFSIEAYSDYRNLEVIVVDNASSDGSREWLAGWAQEGSAAGHRRRLVLNDANLGFAAGNNVGLAIAQGELLVLLNNDTYVTRGWVRTLAAHFRRDPSLGLAGPVTNNIGNEAKLDIEYSDIVEMHRVAGEYTRAHPGTAFPMRNAAFFCVAMPRAVYEALGGLDEAFGVGFFEDDDYCRRVEAAGWGIACAEDVFVHHHLSASFAVLGSDAKRALFERNKAIYEGKWGAWQPHEYRRPPQRAIS